MAKSSTKNWVAWYILAVAILFYCLDYFFRISPSLVITQLMSQYHVSSAGIGIFATAFYIGYSIMQIPTGFLLDRYKLRMVFVIAILLCVGCYIFFIHNHNFYAGVAERFVIGLGSALSFLGTLYIAKKYLPARFFSLIAGITIALGTVVASGMQYIAASYFSSTNWHLVLYAIATSGILLAGFFVFAKQSQIASEKEQAQSVIKNLRQLIADAPLIENAIIGGLFYLPTSIFAGVWGITLLHADYHITETQSSLAIMLLFLGWAIGSPIVGYFGTRLRNDRFLMFGGSFLAFIASIFLLYFPELVANRVYALLLLFGLCSSCQVLVWSRFTKFNINGAPGIAIAVTNMIIILIAALFQLIVGFIINYNRHFFTDVAYSYSLADYLAALTVMPLSFVSVIFLDLVRMRNYSAELLDSESQ